VNVFVAYRVYYGDLLVRKRGRGWHRRQVLPARLRFLTILSVPTAQFRVNKELERFKNAGMVCVQERKFQERKGSWTFIEP